MTVGHNVIEDYGHTGLTRRQYPIAVPAQGSVGPQYHHLRRGDEFEGWAMGLYRRACPCAAKAGIG
jgi:hypothetical protein